MKLLDYPLMLLARTLLLALYLIAFIPLAHWVCWRGGKKGEFRYMAYLLINFTVDVFATLIAPLLPLFATVQLGASDNGNARLAEPRLPKWLNWLLKPVASSIHFGRERVSNVFRFFKPFLYSRVCYPNQFSPLADGSCLAVKGYKVGRPPVIRLFLDRSPCAVIRGVVSVIVNPLYGQTAHSWPHVVVKRLETVTPLVADVYPSPAVTGKILALRIVASFFHTLPGLIFRREASHMFDFCLSHIASARYDYAGTERDPSIGDRFPTVAHTNPAGSSIFEVDGSAGNKKSPKPITDFVFKHFGLLGYSSKYNTQYGKMFVSSWAN